MDISIHQDKFHRVILRRYRISRIRKETQTIRNLLCYYHELACEKYPTEELFNKILAYNYDAKFKTRLTTFGAFSIIEYSLVAVDPIYINDPLYTLDTIKELFNECLKPCVTNGQFDTDVFDRAFEIYESDLLDREDSHQSKATRHLISSYFKNTDRDFEGSGSLADLYEIDIKKLYSYYLDVLNEETISIISSKENQSEDYSKVTLTKKTDYHFKKRNPVEEQMIVSANTKQCYLSVIYEADTYANDRLFYAMSFVNYFLGGSSSSLLFNIAREKYGLCYAISSAYMGATGIVLIKAILDKTNINKCILAIEEALNEIINKNFNIEEARKHYLSVFLANKDYQETDFFNYLIDNFFIDNPKTYEDEKLINDVTIEDVIEAAKRLRKTFIHAYGGDLYDKI